MPAAVPSRALRLATPALLLLPACGDGTGTSPDGPPTAVIEAPAAGATYRAGTTVGYAGSGTDASGTAIPAGRMTWWADFHHDTHTHPFLPPTPGAGGTVEIPAGGETSANVFYRFYLRVEDETGRADTAVRDLLPVLGGFRVVTTPPGLQVLLDGQPQPTPLEVEGVVGMVRRLGAPSPQEVGGTSYGFGSWSHGRPEEHVVETPEVPVEFVANFNPAGSANQPPQVALDVSGTSVEVGQPVTLVAAASDADGEVVAVSFHDGATVLGTDTDPPFEFTWTPTAAGERMVSARATDDDGAVVGDSPGVAVLVSDGDGADTQPPTVKFLQPADSSRGLTSLTASVEATDNGQVVAVEFELDGTPVGPEDTSPPWGFTLGSVAGLTEGQHELRARARDAAGNRSGWAKVTFTLDSPSSLPEGFVRELVVDGLPARVTALAFAPDGRIFVALQNGRIEIVSGGSRLATPFAELEVDNTGERGLIGLALDPDFASNGFVYVHYTTTEGGTHNRVSRLIAEGNVATAEAVLVDLPALSSATNHNGGALAFGPDGKLYVGVGDNANTSRPQDLSSVFGKLLRFNRDGSIPADNPHYGQSSGLARAVWAHGLRNPYTFAFDPSNGLLFINDVGANAWEEVNTGVAGGNYGWPMEEGPSTGAGLLSPRYAYWHDNPFVPGYAIVGGGFYRPASPQFPPDYVGDYFFGDYVTGLVHRLDPAAGDMVSAFARDFAGLTALVVGPDGALYIGSNASNGRGIHRIRYAG